MNYTGSLGSFMDESTGDVTVSFAAKRKRPAASITSIKRTELYVDGRMVAQQRGGTVLPFGAVEGDVGIPCKAVPQKDLVHVTGLQVYSDKSSIQSDAYIDNKPDSVDDMPCQPVASATPAKLSLEDKGRYISINYEPSIELGFSPTNTL